MSYLCGHGSRRCLWQDDLVHGPWSWEEAQRALEEHWQQHQQPRARPGELPPAFRRYASLFCQQHLWWSLRRVRLLLGEALCQIDLRVMRYLLMGWRISNLMDSTKAVMDEEP